MKKKTTLIIILTLLMQNLLIFGLGYYYGRRNIVTYNEGQYLEVYPCNWPTYNLPAAEYGYILEAIKKNDCKEAERRIKILMGKIVKKAKYRLEVAPPQHKPAIERVLQKAETAMESNINVSKGERI
jgi:hypothetical protein